MNQQLPQSAQVKSLLDFLPVACVAFVTWISILVRLDPAGSYPQLPEGPGLTVDEIFNVEQGVYLVEHARALGWLNLIPGSSWDAYQVKLGYNPDHPPLGRWWLGIHHQLALWIAPPVDPQLPFVTVCARTGSATAFALTVLLIGCVAARWSGRATGFITAISLSMMPRVYGHAHLASLETITNLTSTAAVLSIAVLWAGPAPPTRRSAIFAGLLLGLGFLTKIQAIFIPLPVIGWALWQWRSRAIVPLTIWALTAFVVFFCGWPYLWSDSILHLREYFGRTTNRATLQVWYFARKFADKDVPWHYPFVMFALTVPVSLHILGIWGLFANAGSDGNTSTPELDLTESKPRGRKRDLLLLACLSFPLMLFAVPGVAVYDCERLFLTSFPLWALFIGRGWIQVWRTLFDLTRSSQAAMAACLLLFAYAAWPLLSIAPYHLCYYNGVVQVAGGAEALGLEVDYWGVGITRQLIQKTVESAPENSSVAIVPTLHPVQAAEYRRQSPLFRKHGIKTVENRETPDPPEFVLVFHRQADLPPSFQEAPNPEQTMEIIRRGRDWIALLVQRKR